MAGFPPDYFGHKFEGNMVPLGQLVTETFLDRQLRNKFHCYLSTVYIYLGFFIYENFYFIF